MEATARPNYFDDRDQRTGFLAETKVHLPSLGSTFCTLRRHCGILKGNEGAFASEGLTFLCTQVFAADQHGGKLMVDGFFFMTRTVIATTTTTMGRKCWSQRNDRTRAMMLMEAGFLLR